MTSAGYICPECGAGELRLVAGLEIGADSRSDEITVQVAECGSCGRRAAAVYEESRRGRLDSEAWNHTGYRMDADRAAELLALILGCPRPNDSGCTCSAHLRLGVMDQSGRWVELAGWAPGDAFALRRPE